MKPSFYELIETDELQALCEIFSKLTGFGTAILDMEGNVLVATGWQEICTEFHRKNPETAESCRKSDTILGELPSPGAKYSRYRCNNGLIDVSVPIMVEDLQIGRLYTGQFLFAPPDVEYFRRQAAKYGFDEASYLEALQKVQIVTEEQVGQALEFLCRLAEMIGRMGLGNQRLREANEELRENRQELEHRVDMRTAELLAKNEQLRMEIDGRLRAESALLLREQEYRTLVENSPDFIARFDRECRYTYVNPSILRHSGLPMERIIGRRADEILPQTKDREGSLVKLIRKAWDECASNSCEAGWNFPDGWHYFDFLHVPELDEKGRVVSVLGIARDITARKKSEAALLESKEIFKVLAETSPTAIFLYQGEMIIYANPATERLFGYTADELLRMKFWDWAHEDFKEIVRACGMARQRGETAPSRYESRFVTKDGDDRWLVVSAGLIEYHGKPAGVVSFLDITEIKKAEEQIRTALAEKEVLLKEVHHRVKNNMQIISTLLDLQSESIHDEQSLQAFRDSQERIKAMALVHEKLYQSMDLASIDFAEYIEKLVLFLFNSHVSDPERITLKVDVGHLPLDINRAIPCGLIVNELVSNALKHAFPNGRKGEVRVRLHTGDDGRIWISVADNGTGLASGVDFRNTETLGLQLVNMLTRQLSGNIDLQNEKGASFTISFMGTSSG